MLSILQVSQSTLQVRVTSAETTQASTAAATEHFTISHIQPGIIKPVFVGRAREAGNVSWQFPHILFIKTSFEVLKFCLNNPLRQISAIKKQNVISWLVFTFHFFLVPFLVYFLLLLPSTPRVCFQVEIDKSRSRHCVIFGWSFVTHYHHTIAFLSRKLLNMKLK